MLAFYGIVLVVALILILILIWKLGAVGFLILILGGLFLLTSNKAKA